MVLGTWVLAVAALLALRDSREALEHTQRAWIAPVGFKFANLNDATEPLKVRVSFQNIGREPAKSLKQWLQFGYVRATSLPPAQWLDLPIWKTQKEFQRAEICKGIAGVNNTGVAYPTPTFAFTVDANKGKDANYPDSLIPVLFTEVKAQQTMLLVTGCFSYETMNRTRHSTFCVFLNPASGGRDITEWSFSACPVGNDDYDE